VLGSRGILRADIDGEAIIASTDARPNPLFSERTVRRFRAGGFVSDGGVARQVTVDDALQPLSRESWDGAKQNARSSDGGMLTSERTLERLSGLTLWMSLC
jgi:hypothetical protein